MTTTPTRTRAGFVEVTLIVFGLYALAVGLFMMFAPGLFFDTLGTFGVRNDHYIFDNATFEVPQGLLLLAAVRRVSWRVPALAFATLHWALTRSATSSTRTTVQATGSAGSRRAAWW